ncbi:hypothetical protein A2Z33_00665 [Candidatus Gottesmanbacteria bacterium RBG_16_52_11]|uniref:Uncharacterized protein n=1 Tax=Candidatus Gottesmanbacteria bacterium RBG_16_52_11 TaxID=1798374 RepID=A0A1F5YNT8_9BACT|nr:MAG: hypothetical protein A2Z33_00665 [Candidatus Gottesmanbacteria bacterium RBG_16_52_11]
MNAPIVTIAGGGIMSSTNQPTDLNRSEEGPSEEDDSRETMSWKTDTIVIEGRTVTVIFPPDTAKREYI